MITTITTTTTTKTRASTPILLALALTGACGEDSPASTDTLVPLAEVTVGTCADPADGSTFEHALRPTACNMPHLVEVAGRFTLPEGPYPGSAALRFEGQRGCISIFEGYVGADYYDSTLELRPVSPSPSTWDAGERSVLCLVVAADGAPLTSPARGSKR